VDHDFEYQKKTVINLDEKAYEDFIRYINSPPKPSKVLIDLMKRVTLWEKNKKDATNDFISED